MKKITWEEFYDIMRDAHLKGLHLNGVIVYAKSNWDEEYSLESRSYQTDCRQKAFGDCCGRSMFGSSLDDTDKCVRLDWYNWKVDYCYILDK